MEMFPNNVSLTSPTSFWNTSVIGTRPNWKGPFLSAMACSHCRRRGIDTANGRLPTNLMLGTSEIQMTNSIKAHLWLVYSYIYHIRLFSFTEVMALSIRKSRLPRLPRLRALLGDLILYLYDLSNKPWCERCNDASWTFLWNTLPSLSHLISCAVFRSMFAISNVMIFAWWMLIWPCDASCNSYMEWHQNYMAVKIAMTFNVWREAFGGEVTFHC